jgi:hypothetical protein
LLRDDLILVKKLPDVAVRLEDTRPSLGLDILLEAVQHPLNERGKGHHDQHLNYVEDDSIRHRCTSLSIRDQGKLNSQGNLSLKRMGLFPAPG